MKNEDIETIQASSTHEHVEAAKLKLLTFLTQLAHTAEGFCNKLRLSFLLCLLAASWLTFFVKSLFELSLWGLLPIFFGFSLPALFIWHLRGTLQDVIAVPALFPAISDCFRQELLTLKNDTLDHLNTLNSTQTKRSKLKELTAMGRQLLGLKHLLIELRGRLGDLKGDAITSLLVVASPGFVMLIAITTACTVILCTLAGFSTIVYLLIN